jgi:2-polyprenyl-6-methoxyphenol hydroxylase-like FAD-dependent oxidoreductase
MHLNMNSALNILVVGAGIGGSSAAIALAKRGHRVVLIEKQEVWRFQSSGIFVYNNGLESLRQLDVLSEILDAGFSILDGRNTYLDQSGSPIVDVFYPRCSTSEAPPILGIKRAEMHRVLVGRLRDLSVQTRLNTMPTEIADIPTQDKVRVKFSDGNSQEFDLVVGADGIRSAMRNLIGISVVPKYSGLGVWRSVHARPRTLKSKIMMMGIGKRLGIMPISEDKLYLFGTCAEPVGAWYPREEWPQLMAQRFSEFGHPAQQFLESLTAESEVLYTAVEEVCVEKPWHQGRVVLIGDSAHASTPFMGQGGSMAIEDGLVLANCIAGNQTLAQALFDFGKRRYPVCRFVQDVSRQVGEAGAIESAARAAERDRSLKQNGQSQVDAFYKKFLELNSMG